MLETLFYGAGLVVFCFVLLVIFLAFPALGGIALAAAVGLGTLCAILG